MGNAASQSDSKKNMFYNEELIESIDLLASKLIFEQSFQELQNLKDTNYCNEVAILTQRLLKQKLNKINVNMILNRVVFGAQEQDLFIIDPNGLKKLKNIDDRGYDKYKMCSYVSHFYTQIFQAYSAIVTAINPVYVYTDSENKQHIRTVFDDISAEHKNKADIGLRSMCSRRIEYLKPIQMGEEKMTLTTKHYCNMNKKGTEIPILKKEINKPESEEEVAPSKEEEGEKEKEGEKEGEEDTVEKAEKVVESITKEESATKKDSEAEAEAEAEESESEESESEESEVEEEKTPDTNIKDEEFIKQVAKRVAEIQKQTAGQKGEDDEDKSEEEDGAEDEEDNEDEAGDEEEDGAEDEEDNEDEEEETNGRIMTTAELIDTMTLADEPGIQSLEKLYTDTMSLEVNGEKVNAVFKRSDKSEEQYKKDLEEFYKAFVPNMKFDDNKIKSFSDIPLTDFTKTQECNNIKNSESSELTFVHAKDSKDSKDREEDREGSKLFIEYGTHFQKMVKNVRERETELIECLHKLFDFDLDPKKEIPIRIRGDLTEDKLNKEIRPKIFKVIKTMYIQCEKDFQEGIRIYNEIYKHRNPIQDHR